MTILRQNCFLRDLKTRACYFLLSTTVWSNSTKFHLTSCTKKYHKSKSPKRLAQVWCGIFNAPNERQQAISSTYTNDACNLVHTDLRPRKISHTTATFSEAHLHGDAIMKSGYHLVNYINKNESKHTHYTEITYMCNKLTYKL